MPILVCARRSVVVRHENTDFVKTLEEMGRGGRRREEKQGGEGNHCQVDERVASTRVFHSTPNGSHSGRLRSSPTTQTRRTAQRASRRQPWSDGTVKRTL